MQTDSKAVSTDHSTTHLLPFAGAALTVLGGMCWGISGSIGQYLFDYEGMDSRWLVPIRLGLAGIILLVWHFIRGCAAEGTDHAACGKNVQHTSERQQIKGGRARAGLRCVFSPWKGVANARDLVIYGLLGVSLCQFFYFSTIQYSTAAVGTILQDLSPIMILMVQCVRQRRRPRTLEILCIILALAGVWLITTHGAAGSNTVSMLALMTGILSAVCVTIYNIVPGHLMETFPVTLLQGWAFLMGGGFFTLLFRPWTFHYIPTAAGILGIAGCVLVGNVLAFPLYMTGVKLIGPEKAILYGFSEPVTAAVIACTVLHVPFTAGDALGFVLIFLMLVLISVNISTQKAGRGTDTSR